jgi:hypothetical protein
LYLSTQDSLLSLVGVANRNSIVRKSKLSVGSQEKIGSKNLSLDSLVVKKKNIFWKGQEQGHD